MEKREVGRGRWEETVVEVAIRVVVHLQRNLIILSRAGVHFLSFELRLCLTFSSFFRVPIMSHLFFVLSSRDYVSPFLCSFESRLCLTFSLFFRVPIMSHLFFVLSSRDYVSPFLCSFESRLCLTFSLFFRIAITVWNSSFGIFSGYSIFLPLLRGLPVFSEEMN